MGGWKEEREWNASLNSRKKTNKQTNGGKSSLIARREVLLLVCAVISKLTN